MEALEFFREAGRRGGKIGGRRRMETTTPKQRRAWARKAGIASGKARAEKARKK